MGDSKENKWRKNKRKHGMQEGDSGESDSTERGRDKGTGYDRSRCDRRKDEGKKGTVVDVIKRKSIARMVSGRKRGSIETNRESGRGKKSATREMQN